MLIGRHSFIRQSKLSDVAGRIDYISNLKRQEYLYATYQTEGVTPEFWKNLARENQLDFKASGSAGKCIEGREFIIALPESFVEYKADDVVRLFTDSFHKLKQCRNNFVVIDNADILMDDEVRRFINFEFSNQYMLFLRNCDGLNVSDKSFKVMKVESNMITLEEEL